MILRLSTQNNEDWIWGVKEENEMKSGCEQSYFIWIQETLDHSRSPEECKLIL